MHGLRFNDIDGCKYGLNYRKRTRLWNNLNTWNPGPLCKKNCGKVIGNKHSQAARRLPPKTKAEWGDNCSTHKQVDLYKIPRNAIEPYAKVNVSQFLHIINL